MAPKIQYKKHKAYSQTLSRNTLSFQCAYCYVTLTAKKYESHCFKVHCINKNTTCVWCNNYTWPKNKKYQHAVHLSSCSEAFLKAVHRPPPPEPVSFLDSSLTLLNMQPTYEERTLYDITELPTPEYDYLWPLLVDPPPVPFESDNLNLAASYVFKYLVTRDTHNWLHVMIKAVAFQSFLDAMEEDGGTTRTLLFSCWCNGGSFIEPRHRQHRHLVVVAPKGHFFENIWKKVRVPKEDRPCSHFLCKGSLEIKSPFHLIHTLGYLSHRRSQCQFTLQNSKNTPYQMHHFYLYRNIPIDYKLPLFLLFPGGLLELLNLEKFKNVSIPLVADAPLLNVASQWHQKIKHFYGHERGIVVPVAKSFFPTQKVTPYVFHLLGDRKLFFEPGNQDLNLETWMMKHAEGGNCFYDNVEEETWIPKPHYQQRLWELKPVKNENVALKAEMASLKAENAHLTGYKRKCEELEEDQKTKQIKINNLLEENVALKAEMASLKAEKTKQININIY